MFKIILFAWDYLISPFLPSLDVGTDILTLITYHKLTQVGKLPEGIFVIACGSMVLAFFVPLFLICCWVFWVLILKTLWMCISKCLGSSSSTLHGSMPDVLLTLITGQQLESFYDKLLFAIWPFVGPLFFIYAKCTKDQEKLNKFYRLYMWEICLESSIQMML